MARLQHVLAASNCAGRAAANKALFTIRQGCTDPGALFAAAAPLVADLEALRAFLRVVQKAIENGGQSCA